MAGRSPARFLAPLALVGFALALFIVVSNTTKDDASTPAGRDAAQPGQSTSSKDGGSKKKKRPPRSYTVKAGDTPSGIAEKVNVPLERILELNPRLDPQTLTPGTKIKLR
jgi:LysM repeat protein